MQVMYEYAAKIICGESNGRVLAPGRYWTAVNIHNPNPCPVIFHKKVAVGYPSCEPGPVSERTPAKLGPDEASEIDCEDIRQIFEQDFVKGFVVVQSPAELDVVAVYTASSGEGVQTLDVERVPARRVEMRLPDLVPVPVENGDFCNREDMTLFVRVCNQGTGSAGPSTTEVDFGPHGSVSVSTPPMGPGDCRQVSVPIPPRCFDNDCEFEITVNASGSVTESDSSNNTAKGVCIG